MNMKSSITVLVLSIYLMVVGASCGSKAIKDNITKETIMSYTYVTYTNKTFPNLNFDVLKKWEITQNDLEVVFWVPNEGLPQLFLQTVGKFEDKQDIESFYNFVVDDSNQNPSEIKRFKLKKYNAIEYITSENLNDLNIEQWNLIVDVGEGFILLYLKSHNNEFERDREIAERIKASFTF
jgi:hypothetical protein